MKPCSSGDTAAHFGATGGLSVERVTGIEPAFSAWESVSATYRDQGDLQSTS
jgi:hypothetical protein